MATKKKDDTPTPTSASVAAAQGGLNAGPITPGTNLPRSTPVTRLVSPDASKAQGVPPAPPTMGTPPTSLANYNPPMPPASAVPNRTPNQTQPNVPNLGPSASEQNAKTRIIQTLEQYGFSGADLTALTNFAWNELVNGVPEAQVVLDIQGTVQFNNRFPAIQQRIAAGLPPISVADYLADEDAFAQVDAAAGIPNNFSDFNELIAKDVSPTEYQARIQQGYLAVALAPPDVMAAFQQYYGVTKGELAAYFTDPNQSQAILLQKAMAAQIGGAATGSGFNRPINAGEATVLAQHGVTYAQAQTGFSQLAQEKQLYQPLPGQGTGPGTKLTTDQLAGATFGYNGDAAEALKLQAAGENAFFQGGTSVGTSGTNTGAGAIQR